MGRMGEMGLMGRMGLMGTGDREQGTEVIMLFCETLWGIV